MAITQTRPARGSPSKASKGFTLELPMVTLQMHAPDLRLPHLEMPHLEMPHLEMPHVSKQEMGHAVDVARSFLPPPERIAYYGALGALAALGVIEWPVAAAIGVGSMIARREGAGESFNPLHKLQEALPTEDGKKTSTETSTATTPARRAPAATRKKSTTETSATATPAKRPSTATRKKSTTETSATATPAKRPSTATRKKSTTETSATTAPAKRASTATRKKSTSASSATPGRKSAARSTRAGR